MIKINTFKTFILGLAVLSSVTFGANAVPANADAHLAGGDFMQAFNNTTQAGTWRDPISAKPGEIVEFRITAKNDGDKPAEHVQIWGSVDGRVPQGPAQQLVITGKIANANFGGAELTDTATVNVTGGHPEGLRYLPGHARLNGVTDKFNCPNTCDIGDNVLGGIEVGTIQPGDFVEVAFKATVTNTPQVTPSPTPVVTPSPTPVVTPAPSASPVNSINCNGQIIQVGAGQSINCINNVNNNNNTSSSGGNTQTVTVNNPSTSNAPAVLAAQTSNVKELPNTGLPLAGLALTGLTPLGLKLKKFGKGAQSLGANQIWEMREFNKD